MMEIEKDCDPVEHQRDEAINLLRDTLDTMAVFVKDNCTMTINHRVDFENYIEFQRKRLKELEENPYTCLIFTGKKIHVDGCSNCPFKEEWATFSLCRKTGKMNTGYAKSPGEFPDWCELDESYKQV